MTRRRAAFIASSPKLDNRPDRWQEIAACVNSPEEDKAQLTGYPKLEVALDLKRRYCAHCPVVVQCFNWAMDDRSFTGIAGGKVFTGDRYTGKDRHVIDIPTGE